MTPLTEAELLRMREVQAKATQGPCDVHRYDEDDGTISYQVQQAITGVVLCEFSDLTSRNPLAKYDAYFDARARSDWPRLTAWALEARRFMSAHFSAHDPACSSLAQTVRLPCDCGFAEARRLLGLP